MYMTPLERNLKLTHTHRYCPGGNCENLDGAGVVTDRWPLDIYSSIPWMGLDPDADIKRVRDLNQREGNYARLVPPTTESLTSSPHSQMFKVDFLISSCLHRDVTPL